MVGPVRFARTTCRVRADCSTWLNYEPIKVGEPYLELHRYLWVKGPRYFYCTNSSLKMAAVFGYAPNFHRLQRRAFTRLA